MASLAQVNTGKREKSYMKDSRVVGVFEENDGRHEAGGRLKGMVSMRLTAAMTKF